MDGSVVSGTIQLRAVGGDGPTWRLHSTQKYTVICIGALKHPTNIKAGVGPGVQTKVKTLGTRCDTIELDVSDAHVYGF